MRLLIIGSDKIFAIENFYVQFLRELDIDVHHFPAQSIFYDYYNKSIINKLFFKAGLSDLFKNINRSFVNVINSFKPDVILVFKGMEILPNSLELAKKKGIKLINYNPDNPFIFTGTGSGNKNIINSFGIYDLHLTYNMEVKNRIEKEYEIPTKILPFGFNVNKNLYIKCANQSEIIKACFLGNPDKERAAFIMALANEGILMDVYGNNWNKWINHPNLVVFPPVLGEELWKTLRRYRVQLNLMRIHNSNSHNMRSFEVPGVGGIMVAPHTIEHELYFENRKEIFLFNSIIDCTKAIRKLLDLSPTEANKIRHNARSRSITSGYSYKDRAKQLLTELQRL